MKQKTTLGLLTTSASMLTLALLLSASTANANTVAHGTAISSDSFNPISAAVLKKIYSKVIGELSEYEVIAGSKLFKSIKGSNTKIVNGGAEEMTEAARMKYLRNLKMNLGSISASQTEGSAADQAVNRLLKQVENLIGD